MLRDGSSLDHPGELRLLNEDQTLLHVFLAPLHPASSPASLFVDHPIVRPLCLRAFCRGRLQTTTLRSWRRLPDGRHRGRLMIRLIDHDSWIADLVSRIKNARIDIRGDFNAWRTRVSSDLLSYSPSSRKFSQTSSDLSKRDLSNRATPASKLSVGLADPRSRSGRLDPHSRSRSHGLHSSRLISSRSATHTERAEARGVIPSSSKGTALPRCATRST